MAREHICDVEFAYARLVLLWFFECRRLGDVSFDRAHAVSLLDVEVSVSGLLRNSFEISSKKILLSILLMNKAVPVELWRLPSL